MIDLDKGVFKQPKPEFRLQDLCARLINPRGIQPSGFHMANDIIEKIRPVHVHVQARINGEESCFIEIFRNMVQCGDPGHIVPVADIKALKTPLLSQKICHQVFVHMAGDPVQFVVRHHDGKDI